MHADSSILSNWGLWEDSVLPGFQPYSVQNSLQDQRGRTETLDVRHADKALGLKWKVGTPEISRALGRVWNIWVLVQEGSQPWWSCPRSCRVILRKSARCAYPGLFSHSQTWPWGFVALPHCAASSCFTWFYNGVGKEGGKGKIEVPLFPLQSLIGLSLVIHCLLSFEYFVYNIVNAKCTFLSRKESICGHWYRCLIFIVILILCLFRNSFTACFHRDFLYRDT